MLENPVLTAPSHPEHAGRRHRSLKLSLLLIVPAVRFDLSGRDAGSSSLVFLVQPTLLPGCVPLQKRTRICSRPWVRTKAIAASTGNDPIKWRSSLPGIQIATRKILRVQLILQPTRASEWSALPAKNKRGIARDIHAKVGSIYADCGNHTMDHDTAAKVIGQIGAPIVIPMHYSGAYLLDSLARKLQKDYRIVHNQGPEILLPLDTGGERIIPVPSGSDP